MFLRALILSSLLCLAVAAPAQAPGQGQEPSQRQNPDPTQSQTRPEESRDRAAEPALAEDRAPAPVLINGEITTLAFSSEMRHSNYVRGGVSVGATYDDNVLSAPSNPIGDYSYSVLPYILLDQSRPRAHWILNYAAGFAANQRLSERNQAAHNLDAQLEYRLTPHVDLRVQDHFMITTNFDNQLLQGGIPGGGPIQQPNQTIITPLAKQISNLGSLALNYQFTLNDVVGASGTSYESRFRDVAAGAGTLFDTSMQQANGYYSHRVAYRYWIGVAYDFQKLSFQPGFERAFTHSFWLFNTIYLQRRMTLTLFGGPQYFDLESQAILPPLSSITVPASQKDSDVAGGASFSWQGEKTSAQAGFVRKISDGGGLLGVVRLSTASASVRRQLTRFWIASLGAVYGDNNALGDFAVAPDKLRSVSGSVAMEHPLSSHFVLSYGYARDYQRQSGSIPPPTDVNHNRGWVSFSFSFEKALGK